MSRMSELDIYIEEAVTRRLASRTCKTCKHWKDSGKVTPYGNSFGTCLLMAKHSGDSGAEQGALAGLYLADPTFGYHTESTFGCNYWTVRECTSPPPPPPPPPQSCMGTLVERIESLEHCYGATEKQWDSCTNMVKSLTEVVDRAMDRIAVCENKIAETNTKMSGANPWKSIASNVTPNQGQ